MANSDELEREKERFDDFSVRVARRRLETRAAVLGVLESLQTAFERYPDSQRFEVSHCRQVSVAIQGLRELLEPVEPPQNPRTAPG
ncbi:hypothetical protein QTH97_36605 [Variovorax sp. J22R24]|uniref:hypothetical protein n=1 Tax=Variovorax gracilis TaxID=3053502 RepID=UPI002575EE2F|nr:hypothetical protein [Variovorax sp. J22R24]MDM0110448.1 hypothetical protein [Variovorax sp. J22R24]